MNLTTPVTGWTGSGSRPGGCPGTLTLPTRFEHRDLQCCFCPKGALHEGYLQFILKILPPLCPTTGPPGGSAEQVAKTEKAFKNIL